MAQHDYNLANQSGADFRADLNNALSAIVTVNSGATAPSTTFSHQLWVDTSSNVLKIRNAANDAWVTTGVSITADNTFAGNLTGNVTGNLTGDVTGNADTATALETARTINGTSFDGTANISFDTDSVSEGSSNLYYTSARFDSAFSGKSTSDLSEGTNLYYTDTRFDTRLATKDTDDLTEGTNLYFTNARVESYLDAGTATPTFASAVINTSITGSAILDDDTFGTASATTVSTSESIKAYVDSQIGSVDTLAEILLNGNTTGGTDIVFGDNDKAIFGTGSDLQIYSDGDDSYVRETGTAGSLYLEGTNLRLRSTAGDVYLRAVADGAVDLYYDNAAKLATTSSGVNISGTVVSDGLTVDSGTASTTAATFSSDLSNTWLRLESGADSGVYLGSNSGTFRLLTNTTNRLAVDNNGDISFYDDTGTSQNLKWDASADSLRFVDNAKATFGASNDLQIFHDGSNSYINETGTGNLILKGGGQILLNSPANENMITATGNGAVSLFHDNAPKLYTTSTGIDVTGTATMDGLTVEQSTSPTITINDTDSLLPLTIKQDGANASMLLGSAGVLTLGVTNNSGLDTVILQTQSKSRLNIASTGDISFYDDTGTSQSFFWDSSAERLGIGTIPAYTLDVNSGTANDTVRFKSSDDTVTIVLEDDDTVNEIESSAVGIRFDLSGSEKLRVNSSGIDVTGTVVSDGLTVTGTTATVNINGGNTGASLINFGDAADGNVGRIYYDHSADFMQFKAADGERLRINSTGINVTGTATMDGLTVEQNDGSTLLLKSTDTALADNEVLGKIDFYGSDVSGEGAGVKARIDASSIGGYGAASKLNFSTTDGSTGLRKRLEIERQGNISFYDDTGSTQGLFWDASAERLGIGTTSPSATLDLVSSGTNSQSLLDLNSASGLRAKLATDAQDDAYMYLYDSADALKVAFRTDGNDSYIAGGGNVGIGTDSPDGKLDVNLSTGSLVVNNSANFVLATLEATATSSTGAATYKTVANTTNSGLFATYLSTDNVSQLGSSRASSTQLVNTGGSSLRVGTLEATPLILGTNNAEAMRIDGSSGNVGIGTSSPDAKLSIHAAVNNPAIEIVPTTDENSADSAVLRLWGTRFGTANRYSEIRNVTDGSTANNELAFNTNGSERMRIDSSGGVIVNNGGSGNGIVKINGATGSTEAVIFQRGGTEASRIGHSNSADLTFSTGSGVTPRMTLDSSGNLLVAQSAQISPGFGNTQLGSSLRENGSAAFSRVGNSTQPTLMINKNTNDGIIASFQKDGSTVGSIGTVGGDVTIGTGDTGLRFRDEFDAIQPHNITTNGTVDGVISLGKIGATFKDLYLSGTANINGTAPSILLTDSDTGADSRISASSSAGSLFIDADLNNEAAFSTMSFRIDGSEVGRFDTSGNLLLGASSTSDVTTPTTDGIYLSYNGVVHTARNSSGLRNHHVFINSNGEVGTISTSGSATSYNTSSDARLKDVTGEARGLEVITKLNPVAYNWKADGKADEGLIAQEVKELVPNAVTGSEDEHYQMDYSKLVTHLVKGMKEQQEQIEFLKEEIANLKGE